MVYIEEETKNIIEKCLIDRLSELDKIIDNYKDSLEKNVLSSFIENRKRIKQTIEEIQSLYGFNIVACNDLELDRFYRIEKLG